MPPHDTVLSPQPPVESQDPTQGKKPGDALPHPLPSATIQAYAQPVATLMEAQARREALLVVKEQVTAAIDASQIAVAKNHANYLAHRPNWSYEYRIQIDERLRILRRQRQTLQELMGSIRRQEQAIRERGAVLTDTQVGVTPFQAMAQRLLHPDIYAMLVRAVAEETER
jgi:hypothetical protein